MWEVTNNQEDSIIEYFQELETARSFKADLLNEGQISDERDITIQPS